MFTDLFERDLWAVAIYPPGVDLGRGRVSAGKEPYGKGWGLARWTLEKAEQAARALGEVGVGICLGPGRGPEGAWLADVEGDGPEAEDSRSILFGGEDVDTAGWGSARGRHQLVLLDAGRITAMLPRLKGSEVKGTPSPGVYKFPGLPGLELRLGGLKPDGTVKQVQSVVPPTPGTDGQPRVWTGPATIAEAPGAFYDAMERLAPAPPVKAEVPARANGRAPASGRWTPEARAVAYLEKCDPAVSGQAGHNQAFKTACKVGPGFDLAESTALHLLATHYNPRCEPPWSEVELRHKVEHAYAEETRRGWIRDADRNGNGVSGPAKPPAAGGGEQPVEGGDRPRQRIIVDVDQHRVIDEAEVALATDPNIFCRTNRLVRVLPSVGGRRKHHPDRPAGTPMIAGIEDATLGEMLSRHADFRRLCTNRNLAGSLKAVDPPPRIVAALAARGVWPQIRHLEGIIESPSIRPDGSIIDAPGWDEATGLLYLPSAEFGPIPSFPTQADARAAADLLLDLVCDVPFKDRRHAVAWLAALLTVVARFAVNGPVPMFIFDANLRSVGKSLLCDLIAAIVVSRMMPRSPYPEDDAEMRKTLTSIAMVGDRVTMFDNIASGGIVGCAPLDVVLTGTTWKDRPLGTNSYLDMPWTSVIFATGNNIQVRADTFSRVVWGRIESDELRPEERKDFKVQGCRCGCDGDLVRHAMLGRSRFLVATLTILRAHAVAGRPCDPGLPASRYPAWRSVIQAATHWATGINPCETHEEERAVDQDAMTVEALVIGWKSLCEAKGSSSLTVAAAIQALDQAGPDSTGLRDLFMTWSRDNKLPSAKSVGRRLAQFRKRPSRAGSLDQTPPQGGTVAWFVRPPKADPPRVADGAFSAIGGFSYGPTPTKFEDNCSTFSSGGGSQQTHHKHQTNQGRQEVEL